MDSNEKTDEQESEHTERFSEDGGWVTFSRRTGKSVSNVRLCRPVDPKMAACGDEGDGCARGYSFSHKLTKKVVAIAVGEVEIYGAKRNELAGRFASAGLEFSGYNPREFADYLESLSSSDKVTLHTPVVGWRGEVYVTHTETLAPPNYDGPLFKYEGRARPALSTAGTAQEWCEGIGPHMASSPVLMAAIGLALAGPATKLVSSELGGGLCLYGESSRGKTSCAQAAASVYGKRNAGFHKCNNTMNYLLSKAEEHNDLFVAFDEFKTSRKTGGFRDNPQLLLADGETPGRCDVNGDGKAKRHWTVQVLITNERSMEDQMRLWGIDVENGATVRMPGIQIPDDIRGVFVEAASVDVSRAIAKSIETLSARCFGHVGDLWLRELTRNRDSVGAKLRSHHARLAAAWSAGLDNQAARGIERFALNAAALIVAREPTGLATYFTADVVERHIKGLALAWAELFFAQGMSGTATKAVANAQKCLATQRARLVTRDYGGNWNAPHNALGVVMPDDGDAVHVFASCMSELLGGVELRAGIAALWGIGALDSTKSKAVRCPAPTKVYRLDLVRLDEGYAVTRLQGSKNAAIVDGVTGVTTLPASDETSASEPDARTSNVKAQAAKVPDPRQPGLFDHLPAAREDRGLLAWEAKLSDVDPHTGIRKPAPKGAA